MNDFMNNDDFESLPIRAEINMIPFIDIMLVLLIIFIITTPLMTQSITVQLPEIDANAAEEMSEDITLTIDQQGNFFWNNTPVSFSDLENRLMTKSSLTTGENISLMADKQTPYEFVVQAIEAATAADVNNLVFVGFPEKNENSP